MLLIPRGDVPSIGASGGISGLIAFYAFKFPHARLGFLLRFGFIFIPKWIQFPAWCAFLFWLLLQFLGAFEQISGFSNVSSLAHLGGTAVGVALWRFWRKVELQPAPVISGRADELNLFSPRIASRAIFCQPRARMAFDSFRDFVSALDRAGELKRISQPVATELEITEIADREMKSPGGGKALLFEKPTVNGVVSPFPARHQHAGLAQAHGHEPGRGFRGRSRRRTRLADESQAADQFQEAIKLLGLALDLRHAKPKIGERAARARK